MQTGMTLRRRKEGWLSDGWQRAREVTSSGSRDSLVSGANPSGRINQVLLKSLVYMLLTYIGCYTNEVKYCSSAIRLVLMMHSY